MHRAVVMWLRRLRRETAQVVFVVVSLGLPLAVAVMALSLNAGIRWRPLPFVQPEQLVKVKPLTATGEARWLSLPELAAVASEPAPFRTVAGYTVADFSVAADGNLPAEGLLATFASAEFFTIFGISPQLGTLPDLQSYSAAGQRVVLLSHELWQRRYAGDPGLIGRTIQLSTIDYFRGVTGGYRVIGILPRDLWLFWKRTDLVVPMRFDAMQAGDPSVQLVEHVVARLRGGWDLELARASRNTLLSQLRAAGAVTVPHDVVLESLQRAHFSSQARPLQTVIVVALIVILLAAANVAIASLSAAFRRRREIAMRLALGCSPRRLLLDTIADTGLTVACAAVLSVLAGAWLTDVIATAAPEQWLARVPGGQAAFRVDNEVAAVIGGVSAVIALLTSVLVQRVSGHTTPWALISSVTTTSAHMSGRVRSGLVTAEIALATTAAGVGLVLAMQLATLRATDMGIDVERAAAAWINPDIAAFPTDAARSEYYARLLAGVRLQRGIEAAGAVNFPFHFDRESTVVRLTAAPEAPTARALSRAASSGYLEASGIRLLQGRWFDDRDRAGAPSVVVISDALAASLSAPHDAVGQSLFVDENNPASRATVIGVVSATRHEPHLPDDRTVFRSLAQAPPSSIYVIAKGRAGIDPASLITAAVWSVNVNQPVDGPWPIAKWVSDRTVDLHFLVLFTGCVALVGALLAAAGVYAMTSGWVTESAREIGIRRAIGASPLQICQWFARRCAAILGFGFAGGLLLTLAVFRLVVANIEAVQEPTLTQLTVVAVSALSCVALGVVSPLRRAMTLNATTLVI